MSGGGPLTTISRHGFGPVAPQAPSTRISSSSLPPSHAVDRSNSMTTSHPAIVCSPPPVSTGPASPCVSPRTPSPTSSLSPSSSGASSAGVPSFSFVALTPRRNAQARQYAYEPPVLGALRQGTPHYYDMLDMMEDIRTTKVYAGLNDGKTCAPIAFYDLVNRIHTHDSRFWTLGDHPDKRKGEKDLQEDIRQNKKSYGTNYKALCEKIALHLVRFQPRMTDECTIEATRGILTPTGDGNIYSWCLLRQTAIRPDMGNLIICADTINGSPSSAAAQEKLPNEQSNNLGYARDEPANMYAISCARTHTHMPIAEQGDTPTVTMSSGESLFARSNRTDTAEKLRYLLHAYTLDILTHSPELQEKARQSSGTPIDITMMINSAMDLAFEKMIATRLRSRVLGKATEDERAFLHGIRTAVDDLFCHGVDHMLVRYKIEGVDEPILVSLHRPIVSNITLSLFSKDEKKIEDHRKFTRQELPQMVKCLEARWCAPGASHADCKDAVLRALSTHLEPFSKIDTMSKQQRDKALCAFRDFLHSDVYFRSHFAMLDPKEKYALDAYVLLATGATVRDSLGGLNNPGLQLMERTDPLREFMLLSYFSQEAGLHLAVQCKSGLDRTIAMVAARVAMELFEATFGEPFDPVCMNNLDAFKELFAKATNDFGPSVACHVRGSDDTGRAEIKFWNQPSTMFFLNDHLHLLTKFILPSRLQTGDAVRIATAGNASIVQELDEIAMLCAAAAMTDEDSDDENATPSASGHNEAERHGRIQAANEAVRALEKRLNTLDLTDDVRAKVTAFIGSVRAELSRLNATGSEPVPPGSPDVAGSGGAASAPPQAVAGADLQSPGIRISSV